MSEVEQVDAAASEDATDAALRYIRDWCPDSVKDHVASLARQLAEARAAAATLASEKLRAELNERKAGRRAEAAEQRAAELAGLLRECRDLVEWAEEISYSEFSDTERASRYEVIKGRIDVLKEPTHG